MPTVAANIALALVLAGNTTANKSEASFEVGATVVQSCHVSTQDLDFGQYNAVEGGDLNATTDIGVTCTIDTPWTLQLSGGSAGSVLARAMSHGESRLAYNLYTDATRSTVWGNGQQGGTVSGTGSGTAQTRTVHGSIPTGQTQVPGGAYQDLVIATVIY